MSEKSLRVKSFVKKSHLTLAHFISLTYFWSNEVMVKKTVEMTGLSERVVVDWFNFFSRSMLCLAVEEHKANWRRGTHRPD